MGKPGASRRLSRAALKAAEGVFSHSVDMTLWMIAYTTSMMVPQRSFGIVFKAQRSADRFLDEVNYDVVKHALNSASKRGWITHKEKHAWPTITEEGKKRLNAIVPQYDSMRTWDGRMHIVTYDIPEIQRADRKLLRERLQRLGCGRLQDSVWMTPYNPIDTLRSFIEGKSLNGMILVSDLGQDGSIGEETVLSLIVRVYKLEELNDRYEQLLEDIYEHDVDGRTLVTFLSVLHDDPQLPFSLLPSWWKGDKVYEELKSYFAV